MWKGIPLRASKEEANIFFSSVCKVRNIDLILDPSLRVPKAVGKQSLDVYLSLLSLMALGVSGWDKRYCLKSFRCLLWFGTRRFDITELVSALLRAHHAHDPIIPVTSRYLLSSDCSSGCCRPSEEKPHYLLLHFYVRLGSKIENACFGLFWSLYFAEVNLLWFSASVVCAGSSSDEMPPFERLAHSIIGEREREHITSLSTVWHRFIDKNKGSYSSHIECWVILLLIGMLLKDPLRKQWEERVFRNFGRTTRLTALYGRVHNYERPCPMYQLYASRRVLELILLLNQLNQVVVIATGINTCDYVYDLAAARALPNQRAESLLQKLVEFVVKDEQLGKEDCVWDWVIISIWIFVNGPLLYP
ncbi:hypothetical protein RHMOL_Rhmol03G0125700 [Rhododendron molle]|uniref:Uncharacterized protein n=4 Tax=Rhododendron molle TaxID=49168 RepID=A0ACC0PDC0_RHOML|nr:hypothetical protein RHMOL_Rhmol03G0125700 [Rhododendron molle]